MLKKLYLLHGISYMPYNSFKYMRIIIILAKFHLQVGWNFIHISKSIYDKIVRHYLFS